MMVITGFESDPEETLISVKQYQFEWLAFEKQQFNIELLNKCFSIINNFSQKESEKNSESQIMYFHPEMVETVDETGNNIRLCECGLPATDECDSCGKYLCDYCLFVDYDNVYFCKSCYIENG